MPWDLVALKELMDTRFAAVSSLSDSRFDSIQEAVRVAADAMNRRLDGMNEFRQSLRDQASKFVSIDTYESKHQALDDKIDTLADRVTKADLAREAFSAQVSGQINRVLIAIIAAIFAAAGVVALTFVFTHALIATPVK